LAAAPTVELLDGVIEPLISTTEETT